MQRTVGLEARLDDAQLCSLQGAVDVEDALGDGAVGERHVGTDLPQVHLAGIEASGGHRGRQQLAVFGGEAHTAESDAAGGGRVLHLGGAYNWGMVIGVCAVHQGIAVGKAGGKYAHVFGMIARGVHDKSEGSVGHVEGHVERVVFVALDVHLLACGEQSCAVTVYGVSSLLLQSGGGCKVGVFVFHYVSCVGDVGECQVQVVFDGQV